MVPDAIGIQVLTIFLAVYKHFMEAIDAIDNGEVPAQAALHT